MKGEKSALLILTGIIVLGLTACPPRPPELRLLSPELIEEFYLAAVAGEQEKIAEMLKDYPALINTRESNFGLSALHGASYGGQLEVVKFLVSRGANVNARSKGGNVPLVEAAAHNHVEVVEYLLLHKAEVNAVNNEGDSPLHWAAARGATEAAAILIEHGANVNARNQAGDTPLQLAKKKGHLDTAELIEKNGGGL